jgi:cyclopropane fatty-acyl-phospholipid synthase-like methyltransferase
VCEIPTEDIFYENLHLGCGEGYYVRQAIDEGIDAYGIDISRRALWHYGKAP